MFTLFLLYIISLTYYKIFYILFFMLSLFLLRKRNFQEQFSKIDFGFF